VVSWTLTCEDRTDAESTVDDQHRRPVRAELWARARSGTLYADGGRRTIPNATLVARPGQVTFTVRAHLARGGYRARLRRNHGA
jgi:hypothetical protein